MNSNLSRRSAGGRLRAAGVAFLQFINRLDHPGGLHLAHFKPLPDSFEQSNREFATQVLAEFLQTIHHHQRAARIHVQQFVGE